MLTNRPWSISPYFHRSVLCNSVAIASYFADKHTPEKQRQHGSTNRGSEWMTTGRSPYLQQRQRARSSTLSPRAVSGQLSEFVNRRGISFSDASVFVGFEMPSWRCCVSRWLSRFVVKADIFPLREINICRTFVANSGRNVFFGHGKVVQHNSPLLLLFFFFFPTSFLPW